MDEKVQLKLKELKEALSVVENVEDKVIWACDFASFPIISHLLNPIADAASEVRDNLEDEISYLQDQIDDYEFKLAVFEKENTISV